MRPRQQNIVKSMTAVLRSDGRTARTFSRSMYGIRAAPTRTNVGTSTPATVGWKYARSSCSPRKYHGALATAGVTLPFASSSRGALMNRPIISRKMLMTPAARNSIVSRCGQVMTVSSGSFWTRTTASCLTSASSRYGRADIGTRCLSISVRRVGSTGRTTRFSGGDFVSVISERPGDPAVLADAPEVHRKEDGGRQREDHDVEHVEPEQRVLPDLQAAQQDPVERRVDQRRVSAHVRADRDRPERDLVPRQQVAAEAEHDRQEQQDHPDDPVELARWLVGSVVEDPRHVEEDEEHHQVGGPPVDVTGQQA